MLIDELDRELARHYPPEQRHGLNLDAIFQRHIRFFVARLDASMPARAVVRSVFMEMRLV